MLIVKEDSSESGIEKFGKLVKKNLFKINYSKSIFKLSLGFIIGVPFLVGTTTLGNKILKKLPEEFRLAVAYQIEYLNMKEIFSYSNLKSFYKWPFNYINGHIANVDSINLNVETDESDFN